MSDPILLVCARAGSIPAVPPGTLFNQQCSRCNETVAIAPTGQKFCKENPSTVIVCHACLTPSELGEALSKMKTAGSPEELAAEFRSMKPNTWSNRN